jgi:hypothetical protein
MIKLSNLGLQKKGIHNIQHLIQLTVCHPHCDAKALSVPGFVFLNHATDSVGFKEKILFFKNT